jgi:hypothetical protein
LEKIAKVRDSSAYTLKPSQYWLVREFFRRAAIGFSELLKESPYPFGRILTGFGPSDFHSFEEFEEKANNFNHRFSRIELVALEGFFFGEYCPLRSFGSLSAMYLPMVKLLERGGQFGRANGGNELHFMIPLATPPISMAREFPEISLSDSYLDQIDEEDWFSFSARNAYETPPAW